MPDVHLLDGTFELFRHFFAVPSRRAPDGVEVGAVGGVLRSVLYLLSLRPAATHLGVATDHVVESFRNDLFAGYKTSAGVPPELLDQFQILEDGLRAIGVLVWPMVELEADDGLAIAATRAAADPSVARVFICTPDKDLAQCVRGDRIVMLDRRGGQAAQGAATGHTAYGGRVCDEPCVRQKYGVAPTAIPDWLALVGDTSDGYPGITGFGPKTASVLLARFGSLEAIPDDPAAWGREVRGAARLAAELAGRRAEAALYKRLATLRTEGTIPCDLADLEWKGVPRAEFDAFCARTGLAGTFDRSFRWAAD